MLQSFGIIPRILTASLLAVAIAVYVVQAWTMHITSDAEVENVQARLDTSLAILKKELSHEGVSWKLTDKGALVLDGKPAAGMSPLIDEISALTGGVATIFADDLRVATNVRSADGTRALGTRLAAGPARDAVIGRGETYRGEANILGAHYLTVYEPLRDAAGRQVGVLFVGVAMTDVQVMLNKIVRHSIIAAVLVVAVVGAVGALLLRSALQPLRALAGSVRNIADGHLDLLVPCVQRRDQLGDIGRAVEQLRQKAKQAYQLEQAAAAERVAKDRQQGVMGQLTHEFGTSISGVLAGLGRSAEEVRSAAGDMKEAAGMTRQDVASTAESAEQSFQALATVADAADALTCRITEISREVQTAAEAARHAVAQARQTDSTVRELSDAANEIGQVVKLITSIAGQTNLLALNATVEAARAGDAGKGFAVVASAVKTLATQTAVATQQISAKISTIQAATGKAARAVHEVVDAIDRVDQVATTIATAVEHQGAATREIAGKVQQVVAANEHSTRAMLQVAGLADRSGSMSQLVFSAADELNDISGTLRDKVDHFLSSVRTNEHRRHA